MVPYTSLLTSLYFQNMIVRKKSFCDALPVFKKVEVMPFLVRLYNHSLSSYIFPEHYKCTYITLPIKKQGLVSSGICSYRPISNLPASKLDGRLDARQDIHHLQLNTLLPELPDQQSAHQPGYSIETAILHVCQTFLKLLMKAMSHS